MEQIDSSSDLKRAFTRSATYAKMESIAERRFQSMADREDDDSFGSEEEEGEGRRTAFYGDGEPPATTEEFELPEPIYPYYINIGQVGETKLDHVLRLLGVSHEQFIWWNSDIKMKAQIPA